MRIRYTAFSTTLLTILISNHITSMENPCNKFSSPTAYPYKDNPTLYENTFKAALAYKLTILETEGESPSFLKNYETSLLTSMQKQKNNIIKNMLERKKDT